MAAELLWENPLIFLPYESTSGTYYCILDFYVSELPYNDLYTYEATLTYVEDISFSAIIDSQTRNPTNDELSLVVGERDGGVEDATYFTLSYFNINWVGLTEIDLIVYDELDQQVLTVSNQITLSPSSDTSNSAMIIGYTILGVSIALIGGMIIYYLFKKNRSDRLNKY